MVLQYRDNVMTAGKGLWSNVSKEVVTVGFSMPYINESVDCILALSLTQWACLCGRTHTYERGQSHLCNGEQLK